jgi:hypothetical protein
MNDKYNMDFYSMPFFLDLSDDYYNLFNYNWDDLSKARTAL